MVSIALEIPPAEIAFFKAIVESYDNLVTLRTEDPSTHRLRMWFAEESESDIMRLFESLSGQIEVRVLDKKSSV